jgi:LEA14-like dessication related protein
MRPEQPTSLSLPENRRMFKVISRLMIYALCAGLLTACASNSTKLEPPRVQLLGIQVLSTDMFAQKFKTRLQVQNPNQIEVPVRGIDFEVLLLGDRFAQGVSNDQFIIPALGEAEFDLTVTTSFVSAFGRLISRMGGAKLENIDYEIVGTLYVDKGFVKKIPFNNKGTLNFSKALEAREHGQTTL